MLAVSLFSLFLIYPCLPVCNKFEGHKSAVNLYNFRRPCCGLFCLVARFAFDKFLHYLDSIL